MIGTLFDQTGRVHAVLTGRDEDLTRTAQTISMTLVAGDHARHWLPPEQTKPVPCENFSLPAVQGKNLNLGFRRVGDRLVLDSGEVVLAADDDVTLVFEPGTHQVFFDFIGFNPFQATVTVDED